MNKNSKNFEMYFTNNSSEEEGTTRLFSKITHSESLEIKQNLEITSDPNINQAFTKILETLQEIKGEIKDLKDKFTDESKVVEDNFTYLRNLLDYQFEISSRWKVGKDYGPKFANLYGFNNFKKFEIYFNEMVDSEVKKKMFDRKSKFKSLQDVIRSLYASPINKREIQDYLIGYENRSENIDFQFWCLFNFYKLNKKHIFSTECEVNIGGEIYFGNFSVEIHLGEIKLGLDGKSHEKAIEQTYNPLNFLTEILNMGLERKYKIDRYAYIYYGRIKKDYKIPQLAYYDEKMKIYFRHILISLNN